MHRNEESVTSSEEILQPQEECISMASFFLALTAVVFTWLSLLRTLSQLFERQPWRATDCA